MEKINREDMLELTRRMTLKRNCFDRIAGAYMDEEGFVDGTFNRHFQKLTAKERQTNLDLAKTIPFSDTNRQLREYVFQEADRKQGSLWQLLMALKECGLENDAMLDVFYEEVFEFLICTFCPVTGDYEPGKPEYGFLFPAFRDRSSDIHRIDIFREDGNFPQTERLEDILFSCN